MAGVDGNYQEVTEVSKQKEQENRIKKTGSAFPKQLWLLCDHGRSQLPLLLQPLHLPSGVEIIPPSLREIIHNIASAEKEKKKVWTEIFFHSKEMWY